MKLKTDAWLTLKLLMGKNTLNCLKRLECWVEANWFRVPTAMILLSLLARPPAVPPMPTFTVGDSLDALILKT